VNDAAHPDEVERLRIALWGPAAFASAEAAEHAESCDACAEDVDFHRRLKDAMRRLAEADVSPGAMEAARDVAQPPGAHAVWMQALALPACAGVRSSAPAEMVFVCDVRELRLNVVLHPAGRAGRFSLSGQTLRDGATPAAGVGVTLYLDRVAAATTTTDSFGEFSFGAHAGSRFGLALATGEEPALVEFLPQGGVS
jgi:hypothetical protein